MVNSVMLLDQKPRWITGSPLFKRTNASFVEGEQEGWETSEWADLGRSSKKATISVLALHL
jgi:hypothetical protein